nr:hypothetical protein [Tanacetum cinerariifolium]
DQDELDEKDSAGEFQRLYHARDLKRPLRIIAAFSETKLVKFLNDIGIPPLRPFVVKSKFCRNLNAPKASGMVLNNSLWERLISVRLPLKLNNQGYMEEEGR